MVKCWIFTVIGIALFVNVAICDNSDSYSDATRDLAANLPRYLKEAIEEEQRGQQNSTARISILKDVPCFRDFLYIFKSILNKELWAITVFDSWGKLPSGILNGDLYELGDFDQCLGINAPNRFAPQYCVARIAKETLELPDKDVMDPMKNVQKDFDGPQLRIIPTTKNALGLNLGICVPKTCNEEHISRLFNTITKKILRNKVKLSIIPDTCHVIEDSDWNFDTGDFICLTLLVLLVIIAIPSTIYDIVQTRQNSDTDVMYSAFSFYTNGKKLFACKRSRSENAMECLNGIRVFSAIWVVYAHSFVMAMAGPVFNLAYIPDFASKYTSTILLAAPFSVDTFLFLSGLLITWSLLNHMKKTNGKINIAMLYFHRYLRLTPILGAIVLISVTLYPKVSSGPLWHLFMSRSIHCDKYWWTSILYIQNYYNPKSVCLSHTWYLSVDMQLFLFAPFLCYLLYRLGYKFLPIIFVLVGGCVFWTFWIYTDLNIVNQLLNVENDIQEIFALTYFPTHIRATPWLFGVGFGYFLYRTQGRRTNWSILRVGLHWLLSGVIVAVLAVYTYNLQQLSHEATPLESGIYTPLSRVAWSIYLCLSIYACIKGYGGPVNWFLSLPQWKPLARLSYAIYLIHMPLMLMISASTKRPIYFSGRDIFFKFVGELIVTTLVSVFATLLFESPVIAIEKAIFGKKTTTAELRVTETRRHRRDSVEAGQSTAP